MKFLRITIVTRMERNQALSVTKDVVESNGGWIVSHTLFSNAAANINFEMPSDNAGELVEGLTAATFSPKVENELPMNVKGDIRGCLSLNFIHTEPDLKRDVPAFG